MTTSPASSAAIFSRAKSIEACRLHRIDPSAFDTKSVAPAGQGKKF
jgi:hypothetical protein